MVGEIAEVFAPLPNGFTRESWAFFFESCAVPFLTNGGFLFEGRRSCALLSRREQTRCRSANTLIYVIMLLGELFLSPLPLDMADVGTG